MVKDSVVLRAIRFCIVSIDGDSYQAFMVVNDHKDDIEEYDVIMFRDLLTHDQCVKVSKYVGDSVNWQCIITNVLSSDIIAFSDNTILFRDIMVNPRTIIDSTGVVTGNSRFPEPIGILPESIELTIELKR